MTVKTLSTKIPLYRENGLTTFAGAARELRVYQHTIGDLVKCWRIVPKKMSNGYAKGLDDADMDVLRAALNRPRAARNRNHSD